VVDQIRPPPKPAGSTPESTPNIATPSLPQATLEARVAERLERAGNDEPRMDRSRELLPVPREWPALPQKFSRAAFAAAPEPDALALELGATLTARLVDASDRAVEAGTFIDDLARLGHPMQELDGPSVGDVTTSIHCYRSGPGNLIVEVHYAPTQRSPDTVRVSVTYHRQTL
jgi:hypothetical protein